MGKYIYFICLYKKSKFLMDKNDAVLLKYG